MNKRRWIPVVLMVWSLAACGDEGSGGDGRPPAIDAGPLPDGVVLYPCKKPGQTCAAHDPCAIDPICGNDGLCRPTKYQNCDDGLDCTDDVCLGSGACDHIPAAGMCALAIKTAGSGVPTLACFKAGDRPKTDACRVCAPDQDPRRWSPAEGGACDDNNPCTKDDYCSGGQCKGKDYAAQCQDSYSCTDDICDGKGGCKGNLLKKDWCLINGKCVQDQQGDSSGCSVCDVSRSQSAWTALPATCKISGKCYKPGDLDPTKCAECDPQKDPTGWTPLPGLCTIDGRCYKPKDKNAGGCAECDPTVDATAWTVKGTTDCYIDGKCRQAGAKDNTGCAECKPSASTSAWTPIANTCLIDGSCKKNGDKHPQGCAECRSSANATSWTLIDTKYCVVGMNCVDKNTSAQACGKCGVSCGATETCDKGTCRCGTTAGTVGGGPACRSGLYCSAGACSSVPAFCAPSPKVLLQEIAIGSPDYVVLKNISGKAVDLKGYELVMTGISPKAPTKYKFAKTTTLAAAATIYVFEYSAGKQAGDVNTGDNIPFYDVATENAAALYDPAGKLLDYWATIKAVNLPAGATYAALPWPTNFTSATQSFQRTGNKGSCPTFDSADWAGLKLTR